uniref:Uncharacterized protein n=1 Tax=Setaria viridis TaxID=4556 RepID=A0A4U6U905_SETVI|nr:hypothetical protein SEVIR_5G026901v2 [Setaria viridis]
MNKINSSHPSTPADLSTLASARHRRDLLSALPHLAAPVSDPAAGLVDLVLCGADQPVHRVLPAISAPAPPAFAAPSVRRCCVAFRSTPTST